MTLLLQMSNPNRLGWASIFKRSKVRSHYLIPVAGKPILQYFIENALRFGGDRLVVLDTIYDPSVEALLNTFGGIETIYRQEPFEFDVKRACERYKEWIDEETYYIPDMVFPRQFLFSTIHPPKATGVWLLSDKTPGVFEPVVGYGEQALTSVSEYFALNFHVLHSYGRYVLPSYRTSRGLCLGQNVHMHQNDHIHSPVQLGDDVFLGTHVTLDETIVGARCSIGDGASLRRCVVFRDTQIGPGVYLQDKIIDGNRIIDPLRDPAVYEEVSPRIAFSIKEVYE